MTRDIDTIIEESLADDEKDLLARLGDEPGFFKQARANFNGPLAWVFRLLYILNIASFAGFAFAAWKSLTASELLPALHWGLGAVILVNFTMFFKGNMGTHGETNRVLREIRRLELQILRLEAGKPESDAE